MFNVLVGGAIIAAFVAGVVALFAPCCISVMLPAYLATTFRQRRALVAMTFIFGLGVATIIMPIALGASVISRFITGDHMLVFLVGAGLMLALGVAMIAGWTPRLAMPGRAARAQRGPLGVYGLGVFSGAASACCAPVLAGVVGLSGATGSYLAATVVGIAYVFGMVAPLFAIAVLWDHYDWSNSSLLRGRTLTLGLFGWSRRVPATALIGGLLLIGMAALTAVLALNGTTMIRGGWQADLGAQIQHWGHNVVSWARAVPGWVSALVVFAVLGALVWRAVSQHLSGIDDIDPADDDTDDHDLDSDGSAEAMLTFEATRDFAPVPAPDAEARP